MAPFSHSIPPGVFERFGDLKTRVGLLRRFIVKNNERYWSSSSRQKIRKPTKGARTERCSTHNPTDQGGEKVPVLKSSTPALPHCELGIQFRARVTRDAPDVCGEA